MRSGSGGDVRHTREHSSTWRNWRHSWSVSVLPASRRAISRRSSMSRAQIRTPSHQLVDASFAPSELNATPSTAHPDPRRTRCGAPVSASNKWTRPSTRAVAMSDPSGLKARSLTPPGGPARTATRSPAFTSHTSASPSAPVSTTLGPVGSKSTLGYEGESVSIVRTSSPRAQSQILTWSGPSSSKAAVATRRPSGLNRAPCRLNPGARRTRITRPERSTIFAVPSQLAVTTYSPSGLKETSVTSSSCPIRKSSSPVDVSHALAAVAPPQGGHPRLLQPPSAIELPSGLTSNDWNPKYSVAGPIVRSSRPVCRSQIVTALASLRLVTRRRPSGMNSTWNASGAGRFAHSASPVGPRSQIFTTELPLSPAITRVPSGENATPTIQLSVSWAGSDHSSRTPVSRISHTLAVPSEPPVTRREESGLQATLGTDPV